jgi:hypothetical protein
MGFFASPEEQEEKRKKKAKIAFDNSPIGRARSAKVAGMKIFQIDFPLSSTRARVEVMVGAYADSSDAKDYSNEIQSIEAEGWRLEHANYIYRITGSESRDKFLASGQQEAVSGEIIGIYIFRSND